MSGFQIQEREAVKAGIVSPNVYGEKRQLSPQARLSEAEGLARSIKLDIAFSESVNIKDIRAGSYFGEGYIDKLRTQIEEQGIELLIVDSSLSPLQQRNLEKKLNTKVIDRRALILEIFGERAQTKEGKLQVELAHLSYQRSRLVRSWTHLERQRGGAGFLGGPGERQIELDRRIIDEKIIRIQKELEKVKQTRSLQRRSRKKIPYPVVALVGYTNAGKSSIFNFLTGAAVLAENQLFATLDTTVRKVIVDNLPFLLSDTVGFIRYEVGVIGENSSEITFSGEAKDYGDVVFGSSYSVGNIYSRSYWTRRLVLGSENATESEFVLKVTGNLNMFYSGNHSIVISDSAAQTSFKIDVGGQLMSQGVTNGAIGAQGAYIDEVKAKSFAMTGTAEQTLNMYVKSMVIAETVEFGTSNVILHICELDPDSALFDFGGKFSKDSEKKVTLDFSELDLSSISSGTYDIISAGSLEGFSEDGTLADDFIVSGLDDENFSLAWNGNSLQMVVVPEPAAMASAIGAVCLILAGLRRKFRR